MTAPDPKARLLHSAALILPAGAILILGFSAGGPAPAPAGAAGAPVLDPAIFTPPAAPMPPELARTAEWLAALRLPAPGESPMVIGAAPESVVAGMPEPEPLPAEPEPPAEPEADPVPSLRLTALLGADGPGGGGIAVIDGRIRTAGQEVAPGWRLTRVDAASDSIEISHADGRSARIRLRRPGDEP